MYVIEFTPEKHSELKSRLSDALLAIKVPASKIDHIVNKFIFAATAEDDGNYIYPIYYFDRIIDELSKESTVRLAGAFNNVSKILRCIIEFVANNFEGNNGTEIPMLPVSVNEKTVLLKNRANPVVINTAKYKKFLTEFGEAYKANGGDIFTEDNPLSVSILFRFPQ